MFSSHFSMNNASVAALILASVALSGCSSNGVIAAVDELPTTVTKSASGVIATNTGAVVSSVGGVVNTVGSSIATTEVVGIDSGVMTGLGGAVQQTGNAVDILGQGTGSSLGLMGQQEADILALQLESAPLVVEQVGGAVSSVGDAVAAIDNGELTALSPLTDSAGALLNQTGAGIASLSGNMTDTMAIPVVQQVTRGGSTMIHMIAINVETTTQNLGASTGLGVPVNNLLVGTGLTVKSVGDGISTTFATSPLLVSTGAVVSSIGTTVASIGGLVTSPTSDNTGASPGSALTALTTPSDFSNALTTVPTQTTVTNVLSSLSR